MDILVEYSVSQREDLCKACDDPGIWACWYRDVEEILPVVNSITTYPYCYVKFKSADRISRLKGVSHIPNKYTLTSIYGAGTKVTFMYNGHEEQRLLLNDSDTMAMSNMVNLSITLESI